MGWCAKSPPLPVSTSFSPVTFTKVEISPQNFWPFSFNPYHINVKLQAHTYRQSQIIEL